MPQCCRRDFPAESSTAAGFISDRALSSPEAMASRAACRAKRRTNPSREEAAPRAFSSGAASALRGSLAESVAMDALEWPRRAASELLGLRAGRSLRHHFREVTIILDYAAA